MSSTDDLWQRFNELEFDNTEKVKLCYAIKQRSSNTEEKKHLEFEINALHFEDNMNRLLDPSLSVPSLSYDKEMIENAIKCFKDSSDRESGEYYERCYYDTPCIHDKWRYALCCWIVKQEPKFLKDASDSLFKSIEICLEQRKHKECTSLLVTLFNFSRYYGLFGGKEGTQQRDKIIKEAFGLLDELKEAKLPHFMIDVVKVLSQIKRGISAHKAAELISLLRNESNAYREMNNVKFSRSILEASLEVCNLLEDSQKEKERQNIYRMLAECYEDDADLELKKQGGNKVLAYTLYRQSIEWYRKSNDNSKVEKVTQKIASINLIGMMDVDEIITLKPSIQFRGSNGYELIREILNYAEASVQSVSRTIDEVEQELDEHPLPLALPNVIVGEKYPVAYNDDEESIIKSQTVTALKTQIQEEDQHKSTSVQELEDNKRILPEHFVKFLSDKGLEGDLQKLISHGIERHFAKDYVSSIHILIPQVEATLRDLLSSKGFKPLQIKEKDNVMDLELGKMLTKEDTKRLLKEDFRKYLYVKFADQKGMNLRNGVSHRLLPYAEFEHANSLATILAILLITERLI
jgi:hypothetical protein